MSGVGALWVEGRRVWFRQQVPAKTGTKCSSFSISGIASDSLQQTSISPLEVGSRSIYALSETSNLRALTLTNAILRVPYYSDDIMGPKTLF